jgi:hypothetical protein
MFRGNDKNFFGADTTVPVRIRGAWEGRVSGCLLGKPVEVLSFKEGRTGLESYLREADAFPLRDYVPMIQGTLVDQLGRRCCRGHICRAEPDDDINYTVLALLLLEDKGTNMCTDDVARAWLRLLPAGTTWTAERHAYRVLLDNMADEFVNGEAPGFDLSLCSDSDYNGVPRPTCTCGRPGEPRRGTVAPGRRRPRSGFHRRPRSRDSCE